MLYYVYISEGGIPKTGLTPDWEYLLTAENGADKSGSAPTINEVGGGWYNFELKFIDGAWDTLTEDITGVIDAGATLNNIERYLPITITKRELALMRISHKMLTRKYPFEPAPEQSLLYSQKNVPENTLELSDVGTTITREIVGA